MGLRYWMALGVMGLGVMGLSGLACASDSGRGPGLLLVPGLYGVINAEGAVANSHVHADFRRAIGMVNGDAPALVISRLQERFDTAFAGEKVERITPENKSRTYAVSLELMRADRYCVKRPDGTVDLYLPVSVRLYITSLISGEVLFSRAVTDYRQLRELEADLGPRCESEQGKAAADRIDAAFRDNVLGLVDRVIQDTRDGFKPFQINARVSGQHYGLYLVDRGIDAGIAVGTELVNPMGAGIRILHSGKTYAVGEATLGDIHQGEVLSMYSTIAASDIIKPRALVLNADTPADLPGAFASQQLAENLGNQAAFSVVPVNPDFQAMMQHLATTDGIKQDELTQKRALPDYFVRIRVAEPVTYELPTSKSFGKLRVLEGTAAAELMDQEGRVVYVSKATAKIEDEILDGGIAFDSADRRKILYGNLFSDLSQQFIRDVRFKQDILTVTDAAGAVVTIEDPQRLIAEGQSVRLYRSVGTAPHGQDLTLVPLWDLNGGQRQGGVVEGLPQLPVSGKGVKIEKGDRIVLQRSGSGFSSTPHTVTLCNIQQDKGTVNVNDLRGLSYFAMASASPLPFMGGEISLSEKHHSLNMEKNDLKNAGFRAALQQVSGAPELCYQPLVKIDAVNRECKDDRGVCDAELHIIAGVALMKGDQVISRKAVSQKTRLQRFPLVDEKTYLVTQAAQRVFSLLADSVRQLDLSLLDSPVSPPLEGNKQ